MRMHISWLALLALPCASLGAAELMITGTPGAEVFVDGEALGTLPLATAIELEAGQHSISVRQRGYQSQRETIELAFDESSVVSFQLAPLFRSTAVGSSLLLAGMGQLYERRPKTGFVFLGLQLTAVVTAIFAEASFKDDRDEYERATYNYDQAITEEDLALWRGEAESAYADMEDVGNVRDAALIAAAAVGLLSALDAWWNFPDDVQAVPATDGLRIGWGGSF